MKQSLRSTRTLIAALALTASAAAAQQAAPAAAPAPLPDNGPKVGDMAPDFTLPTATKDGVGGEVGSSRVDLQACKLEYSIVSPK